MLCLALQRGSLLSGQESVLHFAPEPCLMGILRSSSASYQSADFTPHAGSIRLNIENISLPSSCVDVVIANHVLEHVDDKAALCELNRILSPRGRLITTVPIIEAWERTYEDPQITREADRERHFAQADHVRYYGRDFRDRVKSSGFSLHEFQADGPSSARYGLIRGECVFIARKDDVMIPR
ncbi:MAG TPA: methyltransferase domain-containing protein [Terracidiphilus sp.]|nr:methyltransferase domain-containing protein [Terracidiphilus sp.]